MTIEQNISQNHPYTVFHVRAYKKNLGVTSKENPRLGVGVLKFSGTIVYGRTRAFQKC